MNIKVIIAMHKPYAVPADELYLPLHVGAKGKEAFCDAKGEAITGDDSGDEISEKNPQYCELTGLYWAWKNLDADAYGLVHYRRHFKGHRRGPTKMDQVLTLTEAEQLLDSYDILMPKKRQYYIESLYSHYKHTLDGKHLDMTREIIERKYPEYLAHCVGAYTATGGHMFNMCIMKREYMDAYLEWLFDILNTLEVELRATGELDKMSAFDARLFGRVSEILMNVWLRYQLAQPEAPRVKEIPTMHMESVNWFKKGSAFLQAKFFGKKYDASF